MSAAYEASVAWYVSQNVGSEVSAHDLVCAGASPNHSATWAFTFGEVIQFIHWYMQFGCLALAAIIQVSDQPVTPSLGTTVSTFALPSDWMRLAMTCQVVPITEVPDSYASTSLV